MAAAVVVVPSSITANHIVDASVGATAVEADSNSGTFYRIWLDNSGNPTEGVYLKLYDVASIPTLGTARPDHQFYAPASETVDVLIPEGIAYANGLWYAVSKEPGVPTTSSPSNTVSLLIGKD